MVGQMGRKGTFVAHLKCCRRHMHHTSQRQPLHCLFSPVIPQARPVSAGYVHHLEFSCPGYALSTLHKPFSPLKRFTGSICSVKHPTFAHAPLSPGRPPTGCPPCSFPSAASCTWIQQTQQRCCRGQLPPPPPAPPRPSPFMRCAALMTHLAAPWFRIWRCDRSPWEAGGGFRSDLVNVKS